MKHNISAAAQHFCQKHSTKKYQLKFRSYRLFCSQFSSLLKQLRFIFAHTSKKFAFFVEFMIQLFIVTFDPQNNCRNTSNKLTTEVILRLTSENTSKLCLVASLAHAKGPFSSVFSLFFFLFHNAETTSPSFNGIVCQLIMLLWFTNDPESHSYVHI